MAVKFFRIVSYVLMVAGVLFILGAVGGPDDPQYATSMGQIMTLLAAGFISMSFGWRMYVATEPRPYTSFKGAYVVVLPYGKRIGGPLPPALANDDRGAVI